MANWYRAYKQANPYLNDLVEVKRDRHSVHFLLPDGKGEAHFTGAPSFYQDEAGAWQELDTALVDAGTYWHAPGTKVRIRKSDRRVTIEGGNYSQASSRVGLLNPTTGAFRALWTLPVGTVDDDCVVARNNDYEYCVRVTETGLRETLTIKRSLGSMGAQAGEYLVIETVVEGATFPDGWVGEWTADAHQFPLPTATDANGKRPECRQYAKTSAGTQYLYTGILAEWFADAAYPVVIDPDFTGDTTDGYVQGYNTAYATARTTSSSYDSSSTSLIIGQESGFFITRSFLKFDTSSLSGKTVSQANLKLYFSVDFSDTDFDVQIVKQNWASQDPLSDGNREAAFDGCLSGDLDDSIWKNTGDMSSGNAYTSGNLSAAWVNTGGSTYYSLRSSRDYGGTQPSGNEYIYIAPGDDIVAEYRPVLIVVYYDSSGDTRYPGTMAAASSAPYDDDNWENVNNAKTNDASYANVVRYTAGSVGPTGANNTLTTTNAVSPYDDLDWGDKTGVNADDTDLATITSGSFDTNVVSYLAKAQGFGFSIDAAAVITGVKVDILRARDAGSYAYDACVQLLDDSGNLTGNNKAATATNWPSSLGTASYGGAGDTWGATLTPTVVNDADFGVGLAVKAGDNNTDISVDLIAVTIYYNLPTFDNGDYSYLLKATNFGWNIQAGQTITGIKVTVERKASAGTVKDAIVKLIDNTGALTGDSKADTSTAWPGSDTAKDYGGTGDVWGATLSPAVLNSSNFGVAIAVTAAANDSGADIDYISMTAYFSSGGGTTHSGAAVIAGTGTVAAAGVRARQARAATAGAATMTVKGFGTYLGRSAMAGTGAVAVKSTLTQRAAAAMAGVGTLSSSGVKTQTGKSAMSGIGALAANGFGSLFGRSTMTGTGALSSNSTATMQGVTSLSGIGSLSVLGLRAQHGASVMAGAGFLNAASVKIQQGLASLAGVGSVIVNGVKTLSGASIMAGVGSLLANGIRTAQASSIMQGIGTLAANGVKTIRGSTLVQGVGALVANGIRTAQGSVIMQGVGSLLANVSAATIKYGIALLAGIGSLSASATRTLQSSAVLSGVGSLFASAVKTLRGSAALSGIGSVIVSGVKTLRGGSILAGVGTLAVNAAKVIQGITLLEGAGALSASATKSLQAFVVMSGVGTMLANGIRTTQGSALIQGVGTLVANAIRTARGSAVLQGVGSLVARATGYATQYGAALLAGIGSLSAAGIKTLQGSATLTGIGSLLASATRTLQGSAILQGVGSLFARAQEGFVYYGAAVLAGVGSLTAAGIRTLQGSSAIQGAGELAATAIRILRGSTLIQGAGSLVASAIRTAQGSVIVQGVGTLVIKTAKTLHGLVAMSGIGWLIATMTVPARGLGRRKRYKADKPGGLKATATVIRAGTRADYDAVPHGTNSADKPSMTED